MIKKWGYIVVVVSLFLMSCSKYQKILKSNDIGLKYNAAIAYYEEEKYDRAMPLFEELIPLLRGTNKAEKVYYYYCYSNFNLDLLYTSSYHFKKFATTFPNSEHAEESLFMSGLSHYRMSPVPDLDPTDTYNAINSLQSFVNTYPESKVYVDSSNVLLDKLREKLEVKSYLNSKQYYKIYDFKAAIIALNETLRDFPETEKKEEILILILKSHYYLANNSIDAKKLERFNNTIDAYYTFVDSFGESKDLKEAENFYNKAVTAKRKIENL